MIKMDKKIPFKSKSKPKLPEKTPEQLMNESHNGIMNTIITQTFTRHAGLPEKTYLKRLGFKGVKIGEDRAVRIAKFNAVLELTKVLLDCIGKANMITSFYRTYLQENDFVDKETENG
jgi:uncharacterized protein (DUF2384 family)